MVPCSNPRPHLPPAAMKRFFTSITNILPTAPSTPEEAVPPSSMAISDVSSPLPPCSSANEVPSPTGSSPTNANEPAEDAPAPTTAAAPSVVAFLSALAATSTESAREIKILNRTSHFNVFSSISRTRRRPCCPGAYAASARAVDGSHKPEPRPAAAASAADVAAVVAFLSALAAFAPAAQTGEQPEPAAAASGSPPSKKAKKESRGQCPKPGCGGLSHEGKCIPYCREGQKRTKGQMPEGWLWWALPRGGVYPLL